MGGGAPMGPSGLGGGLVPAHNRAGFLVPRRYSLDNKIEMHGGGNDAHSRQRERG